MPHLNAWLQIFRAGKWTSVRASQAGLMLSSYHPESSAIADSDCGCRAAHCQVRPPPILPVRWIQGAKKSAGEPESGPATGRSKHDHIRHPPHSHQLSLSGRPTRQGDSEVRYEDHEASTRGTLIVTPPAGTGIPSITGHDVSDSVGGNELWFGRMSNWQALNFDELLRGHLTPHSDRLERQRHTIGSLPGRTGKSRLASNQSLNANPL